MLFSWAECQRHALLCVQVGLWTARIVTSELHLCRALRRSSSEESSDGVASGFRMDSNLPFGSSFDMSCKWLGIQPVLPSTLPIVSAAFLSQSAACSDSAQQVPVIGDLTSDLLCVVLETYYFFGICNYIHSCAQQPIQRPAARQGEL